MEAVGRSIGVPRDGDDLNFGFGDWREDREALFLGGVYDPRDSTWCLPWFDLSPGLRDCEIEDTGL